MREGLSRIGWTQGRSLQPQLQVTIFRTGWRGAQMLPQVELCPPDTRVHAQPPEPVTSLEQDIISEDVINSEEVTWERSGHCLFIRGTPGHRHTTAHPPQKEGERLHKKADTGIRKPPACVPAFGQPRGAPPRGHSSRWPGILQEGGEPGPHSVPHQGSQPPETSADGGWAANVCPHPLHQLDSEKKEYFYHRATCLSFSPCA